MTTELSAANQVADWWQESDWSSRASASDFTQPVFTAAVLADLASTVLRALPLPGGGRTTERISVLAEVGAIDLNLGRVAEAHADAIAILAELAPGHALPPDSLWGVWAAEHPAAQLVAGRDPSGQWILNGAKAWCSGAGTSTHALVTAEAPDGPRLFALELGQPGVRASGQGWPNPALAGTDTRQVEFAGCAADAIGRAGDYIARPGFWHGAVGVAAVWYGGATAIGRRLLDAGRKRDLGEIDLAHLGAVQTALFAAQGGLAAAARSFDDDPYDQAGQAAVTARSARAVVEAAAGTVMDRVGRALGPGPLAGDDVHWRRVGDLQLYLRQSHADRDLADLGRRLIATVATW